MKLTVPLKIGIVQLNPQIGHTKETVARAWTLLNEYKNRNQGRSPDILVFPEFALTGYSFHNRDHILPYTSKPGEGPSYEFAREVSRAFQCYTVIGYPEIHDGGVLYNSAIMTNALGEIVWNYRKSFLYFTDDDWGCAENPAGFQQFEIPVQARDEAGLSHPVKLKTSIGICMDLSNYKFEAPFSAYEFATYNLDRGTELILCPMAWLHSQSLTRDTKDEKQAWANIQHILDEQHLPTHGSQGNFEFNLDQRNTTERVPYEEAMAESSYNNIDKPDFSNITFWLLRFTPYVALKTRYDWFQRKLLVPTLSSLKNVSSYVGSSLQLPWVHEGKETVVVLANRCGIEDQRTVYAGSSGIYKFNGRPDGVEDTVDSTNPSIEMYGNLSKGLEGILVREVDVVVQRPSDST